MINFEINLFYKFFQNKIKKTIIYFLINKKLNLLTINH